jgi:glycerol-3-phosphate dehydrogenase
VDYLVRSTQHVFRDLTPRDVLFTTAGVRALVRQGGSESSVSRMHRVVDGEPVAPEGVISVLGGKITGFRAIAEEVVDRVCRRLRLPPHRSTTASTPLPGAMPASREGEGGHVPLHLRQLYGTRAGDVWRLTLEDPTLASRLSPAYEDIAAQVVYAARQEHCLRLSDFLRRRSMLGASADQGLTAAPAAASLLGRELGWSSDHVRRELESYRQEVDATRECLRDAGRPASGSTSGWGSGSGSGSDLEFGPGESRSDPIFRMR